MQRYVAQPDRMDYLARLASRHAALRRKANAEKRVAIILSNYPTKDARIGNAVGLDTPASAINLLHALKNAGYQVDDIPADGDELVQRIIERCSNDTDTLDRGAACAWLPATSNAATTPNGTPASPNRCAPNCWMPGANRPGRCTAPATASPSLVYPWATCSSVFQPPRGFRREPDLGLPQPGPHADAPLRRLLPLDPRRVPG